MGLFAPNGKYQAFDSSGTPLVGGKLYTYEAGTSTPKATYQDYAGTTPNANPVILDSRGEADVRLISGLYKFVLKDSDDVTIWTVDNISALAYELDAYTDLVYSTKTSNFSAIGAADIYRVNATAGAITVTLPAANTLTGKTMSFIKTDASANFVNIVTTSSELIQHDPFGGYHNLYNQGNYLTVSSDGSQWWIRSHNVDYHVLSNNATLAAYSITGGQWGDITSLALSPGVWQFYLWLLYNNNGAATAQTVYAGVSTTTGNSSSGLTLGTTKTQVYNPGTNGWNQALTLMTAPITVASATTYYMKAYVGTTTNIEYAYNMRARRLF